MLDSNCKNRLADEQQPETSSNSRFGLILFGIYLACYVTFVAISAFACNLFEIVVVAGLNLAVVYGFGLIILALVLAMIYGGAKR